MMAPMLEIKSLGASYGKIAAITNINITVAANSIVSVLGPNGAGKTTLLNAIVGLIPSSGEIYFSGTKISNLPTEERISMGLCLVPEKRELFSTMTVEDNLTLGAYPLYRKGLAYKSNFSKVYDIFPRLQERHKQAAGTLSGGERQMLAIGRALMCSPQMLLLDEPSLGLSPKITKEMLSIVNGLRASGVSILLIEQNVRSALKISDYAYVLETGGVAMEGVASEISADKRIVDSYLGISCDR